MSSKPPMMCSSRAERPPLFSGTSNSASSSASSSRSGSLITALLLEAHEGGGALRHAPFPGVLSGDGRRPAAFLLDPHGPDGVILLLIIRVVSALGRDRH